MIFVAKIDAFPEGRVTGAQQSVNRSRSGYGQIFFLEFDESRRRRMVVVSKIKGEPVCLMLEMPADGKRERRYRKRYRPRQQDQQRQRSHVG